MSFYNYCIENNLRALHAIGSPTLKHMERLYIAKESELGQKAQEIYQLKEEIEDLKRERDGLLRDARNSERCDPEGDKSSLPEIVEDPSSRQGWEPESDGTGKRSLPDTLRF